MELFLSTDDLKTYFFTEDGIVKAVDSVSLRVHRDESIGIVGESGCGKTMTALSILRLVPKPGRTVGGRIECEQRNLLDLTEEEMRQIREKRYR